MEQMKMYNYLRGYIPRYAPLALLGMRALVVGMILMAPAHADPYPIAVVQALDKVTGKTDRLNLPVNRTVRLGTLQITARACDKAPPTEPPESAAFLEIKDSKAGGENKMIFSGWMFMSSPSIAAMEHPVYDVVVVDCNNAASATPPSSGKS
jgi:hypothetical protein